MTTLEDELRKTSIVEGIIEQLERVFGLNDINNFHRFLTKNPGQRRWRITSDYNWGDKNRPQDVAVFTVYPFPTDIPRFMLKMTRAFPRDFKDTRTVDYEAINFFRKSKTAFHIAIFFDKRSRIFNREGMTALQVARLSIESTRIFMEKIGIGDHYVDRHRVFENESKKGSFNVALFNDISILAVCFAFIVGLLARHNKPDLISWCSDRDEKTSAYNGIMFDYALINASMYSSKAGFHIPVGRMPIIKMKESGSDNFDVLVRPPDYLAGPLSSWSLDRNAGTQGSDKYGTVLRDIIAENRSISTLYLKFERDQFRASRIQVHKAKVSKDA